MLLVYGNRSYPMLQDITVHMGFVTEDDAQAIMKEKVVLYNYRASVLHRAPKREYYRHHPVRYGWGQHRSNDEHALKFPPWMETIAAKLPGAVNHCIIIG